MTLEEIMILFNKKNKGKLKPESSFRSAIGNNSGLVSYFRGGEGRKTRYGLKEWEKIMDIKPGSIKQLCYDYINEKSSPVHIFELVQYIKKHRKTTRNNIATNLQLDPHDKYEFFPGSFIGLREKKYNSNIISSFVPMSPVYSSKIGEFMRNHILYPYKALIERYAEESGMLPIQIEDIISGKIENGIFKIKGENLLYNSIKSDNIIKNIFASVDFVARGYNPYRASIDECKFTIQVELITQKEIIIETEKFILDNYDIDFSTNRLILFYHQNLKITKAILFKGGNYKKRVANIEGRTIHQNATYRKSILEEEMLEVDFNLNEASTFTMELLNFIKNGTGSKSEDTLYNIEGLDFSGLSKMDAYSLIIAHVSEEKNIEIGLIDAKSLYEKWKFNLV